MAQSITKIVQPVDLEAKREAARLSEVQKQVVADADGLIEGLKLLQAMHDRGILELLVALFDRGDKVMHSLVEVASQPAVTNALKTAMTAMEAFSKVDSDAVIKGLGGVSEGLGKALDAPVQARPMGVFELMKQLKDPDVSAALGTGLAFLKGVGHALRSAEQKEGDN